MFLKSYRKIYPLIRQLNMKMDETAAQITIKEGQAKICVTSEKVFYNPVQEFNRDLSIAVLTLFTNDYKTEKLTNKSKKEHTAGNENKVESEVDVTILEALSATGLRSIRYAKEVPNVTKIIANDLSQQAVTMIKHNVAYNQVEELIETSHDDACMLMYKHKQHTKRFAVIDLDPYGCPSIFLDSAVQSVQDGGLLLITATDMAVLAGNSPETCYCKYGAVSLKTKCCHEMCTGCDTITLQPLGGFKPNPSERNPDQMKAYLPAAPPVGARCLHCNQGHHLGGPIWSGPIHDERFVSRVLSHVQHNPHLFGTAKRIEGVLSMVREELHDVPLYYTMDKLFGRVHLQTMPMLTMRSAILNAGYKVSYSHASKMSIKTAAPPQLIWDIIRTWEKTHPIKPAKLESDLVARFILSQDVKSLVDLSERPDSNPLSRRDGCLRFQYNPAPHWGPGSRATLNVGEEKTSKSIRNQNKYSKHRNVKRQHSPLSDDDARKKSEPDTNQIE